MDATRRSTTRRSARSPISSCANRTPSFRRSTASSSRPSTGLRFAPIDTVADVDRNGNVALTIAPTEPAPPEHEELYLVADLLDKQIVDVDGRKVVRINDIEVANAGGRLRVVAADVGFAGLLRRLGLRSFGKRWMSRIGNVPRSMIAWDSVAPIRDVNPSQVRLSVKESRLARLHPSELAEIIGDLSVARSARRWSDSSTTRRRPTRSSISMPRRARI